MTKYTTLDSLPSALRRRVGLGLVAFGLVLAALVVVRPEQAKVPLWVIWLACAAVVSAGLAVATYSKASPKRYRWAVVAMLGSMSAVPGWIAFGPGSRSCTSIFAAVASELPCRVAFGTGAALLVVMLAIAVRQAFAATNAV